MWLNRDNSRSWPFVCLPEAAAAAEVVVVEEEEEEEERTGTGACVASYKSCGEVLGEVHVSLRGGVACMAKSAMFGLIRSMLFSQSLKPGSGDALYSSLVNIS